MDTTIPRRPYRARVIEDCRMIWFLSAALADAANRHFMAPINNVDFDDEAEGGDFAGDLEQVLAFIERAADAAYGIDPALDEAIRKYSAWLAHGGPTRLFGNTGVGTVQ
jgi:hypothetical protein